MGCNSVVVVGLGIATASLSVAVFAKGVVRKAQDASRSRYHNPTWKDIRPELWSALRPAIMSGNTQFAVGIWILFFLAAAGRVVYQDHMDLVATIKKQNATIASLRKESEDATSKATRDAADQQRFVCQQLAAFIRSGQSLQDRYVNPKGSLLVLGAARRKWIDSTTGHIAANLGPASAARFAAGIDVELDSPGVPKEYWSQFGGLYMKLRTLTDIVKEKSCQ